MPGCHPEPQAKDLLTAILERRPRRRGTEETLAFAQHDGSALHDGRAGLEEALERLACPLTPLFGLCYDRRIEK